MKCRAALCEAVVGWFSCSWNEAKRNGVKKLHRSYKGWREKTLCIIKSFVFHSCGKTNQKIHTRRWQVSLVLRGPGKQAYVCESNLGRDVNLKQSQVNVPGSGL